MKNQICFFSAMFLMVLFSGKVFTQNVNPLYDNELKFCKTLSEIGYSKAFLQFIAEEGILFAPTPKNGKEILSGKQNDSKGLVWHAEFSEISSDGNFGYTTGPWKNTKVTPKGDSVKTFGHFNTVWEKINGEWKFLIDCGIGYGKELIPKTPFDANIFKPVPKPEGKIARFVFEELIKIDNEFNDIIEKKSLNQAYTEYSSENIRIFRDAKYPAVSLKDLKSLNPVGKIYFSHFGGNAARSGDFAYTFGVGGKNVDAPDYNYLRIWKKEGPGWKIVLDVLTRNK